MTTAALLAAPLNPSDHPSSVASAEDLYRLAGDRTNADRSDRSIPESPKLGPAAPFEDPLFLLGVAAQDRTQLVHVELALAARNGEFEPPRQMTRRQLISEISRHGAALSARDACKVDPRFASRLEPKIHVRHGAVLVSLGSQGLGGIVLRERLYLLASNPQDSLLVTTKQCLKRLAETTRDEEQPPQEGGSFRQRRPSQACIATAAAAAAAAAAAGSLPGASSGRTDVPSPKSPSPLDGAAVPFALTALEALLMGACTQLHRSTMVLAGHVKDELDELTEHGGIQLTVGTDWLTIVRVPPCRPAALPPCRPATLPPCRPVALTP
jgi:hypothetical protein